MLHGTAEDSGARVTTQPRLLPARYRGAVNWALFPVRGGPVMARSVLAMAAVCGALLTAVVAPGAGLPAAPMPKVVPEAVQDKDVTAEVKDWNSAKFADPPTQFRQGHVKARAF